MQFASTTAAVEEGLGDFVPPSSEVERVYRVSARSVALTVTRIGDTSGVTTARYAPVAPPGGERCDTFTGEAKHRCDFVAGYGVVRFRPGETEKAVRVFITDDSYSEGSESFQLRLHSVSGGQVGSSDTATVTITDNDAQAGGANPIDDPAVFVRTQYVDFFRREPEVTGMRGWLGALQACPRPFNLDPADASAHCDRVWVASAFFRSEEYAIKGYFIFRFYRAALGRRPTFEEFSYDLSRVSSDVGEEVLAARAEFPAEFAARAEFIQKYGALSAANFVDALADTSAAAFTAARRQQWKDALAAGTLTRAGVLREVVESEQVFARHYNEGYVSSLYFGFLGRDPEPTGFAAWLAYFDANPSDFRTMTLGFIYSREYRLRFGQP